MWNRSRLSQGFAVALLAAVVLGLSACAPATPTPTTTPTTAAAAPSVTPTPSAAALTPPSVRLPLTCDQVAPQAQLTSALGTPVQSGAEFVTSDLEPYAFQQDGALYCYFVATKAGSETEYELLAMPDIAPARWAADKAALQEGVSQPSPFGANSYLNCESSPKDLKCNLDMLIGTTWLSIQNFSDAVPTSLTLGQALARFKPLLQSAVSAVQGATVAEPLWADPNASAVNIPADQVAFDKAISTSIGAKFSTQVYAPDIDAIGTESEAEYPVAFQFFGGAAGNDTVTIGVLPQGGWAWSDIQSKASSLAGYASIAGIGDQAFSYSDPTPDEMYKSVIVATKGDNLFTIVVDTNVASSGAGVGAISTKAASAVSALIN
ncbi:MAG TPA: hypothetical protein VGI56_05805 [Galbitalea sp.]|jgi:hypothetical protein